jgi:hypothetical protein
MIQCPGGEMADAGDLKSPGRKAVEVRILLRAKVDSTLTAGCPPGTDAEALLTGCGDDPAGPGPSRIVFASAGGTLTTDIYVWSWYPTRLHRNQACSVLT